MAEKEKQSKNRVGYMIFSAAAAVFIWASIAYTSDQDITKTFHNANIQVNGESALKGNGLVVTDIDTSRLTYKMTGKRNDLVSSMNGITIEVDVSQISQPGMYELEYSVKEANPRLEVELPFESVTVEVGEYGEKEIPIEIRQLGVSKDKFIKSESESQTVTIAGAKEELEKVAKGIVSIDISDIESNCEYMVQYLLADKNGNMLTKNKTIESKVSEVKVKNKVYNIEVLPIDLMLSSELNEEYVLDENITTVTPKSIAVGIEDGYSYESVNIKITAIEGDTFKYEFIDEDGMYIPDSERNIKINLTVTPKEGEV